MCSSQFPKKKNILICIVGVSILLFFLAFSSYLKVEKSCKLIANESNPNLGLKLNISTNGVISLLYVVNLMPETTSISNFTFMPYVATRKIQQIKYTYSDLLGKGFLSITLNYGEEKVDTEKLGWITSACWKKLRQYRDQYVPHIELVDG